MSTRFKALSLAAFFIPLIALSAEKTGGSGGSLVGNGAGIVEQNIRFVYESLDKGIGDCLFLPGICGLSKVEEEWLGRIRKANAFHRREGGKVEILSGRARPGFFDTGAGEAHRIAKTWLQPGASIYFNSDFFYSSSGEPLLGIPALYALFVHEFGHQAGIADHGALDQLGAKVRAFLGRGMQKVRYGGDAGLEAELTIVNYLSRSGRADLLVKDEESALSLHGLLAMFARCEQGRLLGFTLENPHWKALPRDLGREVELPFTVWMRKSCIDPAQDPSPLWEEMEILELRLFYEKEAGGKARIREVSAQL